MAVHRLGRACAAALLVVAACSGQAQQTRYSNAHRDAERTLPQTVSGGSAKLRTQLSNSRTAVSVVTADFDQDGTRDLVTGYSTPAGGVLLLQRGNPRAFAPTETEVAMRAAGQLVAPYAAKSEIIQLPILPGLLVTADFGGHGHADLLAANKGDSAVYLLRGHGDGSFASPVALPLSGAVSALTLWSAPSGDNLLVAGVCGGSGCGLQFLDREGVTKAFVATPAAVTAIQTGSINNGYAVDFALIAGNQVLVLDGDGALKSSPTLETLPVAGAAALALGSFVPDRHPGLQIAVLGTDATLHVITRAGMDASYDVAARQAMRKLRATADPLSRPAPAPRVKRTGQAWTEAETVHNVGPGGPAIMLRARLTGGGNDDLAVMAGSQYVTVAHPLERSATLYSTKPVVTVDSTADPVTAAIATRVSPDARSGIITLAAGVVHPLTLTVPAIYHTFNVTTTNDDVPSSTTTTNCVQHGACSLRDAITAANFDRGHNGESNVDLINLPAGHYYLSQNNVNINYTPQTTDFLDSVNIHLEIDSSVDLVGTGGCTNSGTPSVPTVCAAIIDAQQKDIAVAVDYGSFAATSNGDYEDTPEDVFITGVQIQSGYNHNNPSVAPCSPNQNCDSYSGNLEWQVAGASNLVLNDVFISSGTAPYHGGGGVSTFYDSTSSGAPGPLEIDNSNISFNSNTGNFGGGGIESDGENGQPPNPMILMNDLISHNTSTFAGGGVTMGYDSGLLTITNSAITNNTSSSYGGGVFASSPVTMTGTTLSGNQAVGFGAGFHGQSYTYSQTINSNNFVNNTITANSSNGLTIPADGAGACAEATSGTSNYTFHYNRFHGNTFAAGATARSTGLGVGCNVSGTSGVSVIATDNWWGCNPTTATNGTSGTLSGTGCDSAGVTGNASSASLTTLPYTTLVLNISSTTPTPGSSFTAVASLGQDSGVAATSTAPVFYSSALTGAYVGTQTVPLISAFTVSNMGTATYSPSATTFGAMGALVSETNPYGSSSTSGTSFAATTYTANPSTPGTGTASVTVDGQTVTRSFTVVAPDLNVSSAHTGNFKAGDTGDTYTLTVGNIGTGSTSGTVTVVDTLPSGFTATSLSGSGWTCTLASLTCTSSAVVSSSVTFPAITLTVSVAATDVGTYTNNVSVSGGGEINTSNDTGSDPTIVVGQPTLTQAFTPTTVAPNATSTVTYTVGNPSANSVSLTAVAFTATLQTGLKITTAATTTCTNGGSATGAVGASTISLSGATIAAGATCTVTAGVQSAAIGSYTSTTTTPTTSNSNAGAAPAAATLTVSVTPTKLVYTNAPDTPITAGGNSGVIQVALEDAAGNVATNNSTTVVTLTVTASGYTTSTYTATVTNGVANFNAVSLTLAGTYTYTASATGLTNGTSTETVNPGAFAALSGTGPASFTAPGQAGSITVKALDSYGNTVTSFTGTVTLTSNDPLASLPGAYTYTASDLGSHVFTYSFGTAGTALSLTVTSGSVSSTQSAITVNDCILFINTNGTLSRLTDAGVATSPSAGYTGGGAPSSDIAVDASGNIWSVNPTSGVLAEFSKAGTALSGSGFTGGGISAPKAVAIDGLGYVWVVNGNNTVSVFTYLGAPVSSVAQPVTGGTGVTDIAIDVSGNLWITGGTSGTVTEIIGGAAPAPPLAVGVTNATTGTRP